MQPKHHTAEQTGSPMRWCVHNYPTECKWCKSNYMVDTNCVKLPFGVNYTRLCPKGLPNAKTGLYTLKDSFDKLWNYKGGKTEGLRESMASIALHVSEPARMQPVYEHISESIVNNAYSSLNKFKPLSIWIQNYADLSEAIMEILDLLLAGQSAPDLIEVDELKFTCITELVSQVPVLFLDAYNLGEFKYHDKRILL